MIEVIKGIVKEGKKLGRTLGFPTANIEYKSDTLESGTYKISGIIQGSHYNGVGVYFKECDLFEGHFFDYIGDCYGQEITVVPFVKIRENISFESLEQLKEQISNDIHQAKSSIHTVLTFGTFDHFHEGHRHYLSTAKLYGDNLVTIIARDTTVNHVKSLTPTHDENQRVTLVQESNIIDLVELGDTTNYYSCLQKRIPHVICLGYDQHSFDSGILAWYEEQGIPDPEIIRLDSFKPEQYKSSNFRK